MTLTPTLLTAVSALAYAALFVAAIRRLALQKGWFDRPHAGRVGAPGYRPIPRVGGLGILGAVGLCLAPLAMRGDSPVDPALLLAGVLPAAVIGLIGVLDDVRAMSPAFKMLALLGGGVISMQAGLRLEHLPLVDGPLASLLGAALTLVWFVAVPTAFNFIDGLDGLAAGVTVVACATLAVLGAVTGDTSVVLVAALVGAATAGFWWHNRHPAKIFMGDGGAMFLGYVVAALSVRLWNGDGGWQVSGAVALAAAVPLVDFVLAMVRRLRRAAPFSSDGDHLHHVLARRQGHATAVRTLHVAAGASAAAGLVVVMPALLAPALALVAVLWAVSGAAERVRFMAPARLGVVVSAVLLVAWSRTDATTPSATPSPRLAAGPAMPFVGAAAAGAPSRSPLSETQLP